MPATKFFICAGCGEELPSRELSSQSLKLSGCRRKSEAVDTLPPQAQVCSTCQQEEEVGVEVSNQPGHRSEQELWQFSGVQFDEGILTAYALNY